MSKRIAVAIAPAIDIPPRKRGVRQHFVNYREQQRDQTEGDNEADNADQELCAWKNAVKPGADRRQGGADNQRYQQQEAKRHHQPEAGKPRPDKTRNRSHARLCPPDGV